MNAETLHRVVFDESASSRRASFPTTHWSVIVAAAVGTETQASEALETLCRQYWYPLYVYARRGGRPHHEAEDCTQEFLARLLATGGIAHARADRGRFRTFLLTAMRNFLIKEWRKVHATKRGGGAETVLIDVAAAEERFSVDIVDPRLTPEQAFDHAWAVQLIEHAAAALRHEYERRGEGRLYAEIAPLVLGQSDAEPHVVHAARLGMSEHAFTVALQRLRQRLGAQLRQAVAETVPAEGDVESELRYLIATAITVD